MKIYTDKKGNKYCVREGVRFEGKIIYYIAQKPLQYGLKKWEMIHTLPRFGPCGPMQEYESAEEAQKELDRYAKEKEMILESSFPLNQKVTKFEQLRLF